MATYKAVMRPALEYVSSIWSSLASSTTINKLQVMQNTSLRTATGCTQDTNIQHLHDETLIHEQLHLHASQNKQKTHHPSHPIHKHTTYFNTPRLKKTLSLTMVTTQQTFPQTHRLVYVECECFVMQMLYVCVLCASCGSSQCCVLHDLQFVNAGRGCNRRPYRRGILQSRSHNCFIGSSHIPHQIDSLINASVFKPICV